MRLNRAKVNLSIDAIMFILMMAVAGIGFLIKYVLVPGFKRHEIYDKDIELYYWGIDRHQWGTIHLIVSLILLFLLFLHIVFYWKQLVNIFKRMVPAKLGRVLITSGFVACSLFLAVMPLFIKPEIKACIVLHKNHPSLNEVGITEQHPLKNTLPNHDKEQLKHDMNSEIKVYGYMTLKM